MTDLVAVVAVCRLLDGQLNVTCTEVSECVFVCVGAAGGMIDRVTVFCSNPQELQEWLEHLQPFTKGGSPAGTIVKVRTQTHSQSIQL